ncbi:MAG TPA: hypothetical protein VFR24_00550 [Candidatus Angelobacter sp.]|nr:hypothetical protein [Candidatus Angelobacter sp.]
MLHITNGDSVVGTFRQVRFPGVYLPWRDVLHDGPVPQTATLSELSDARAQALASFGAGSYEAIRADFAIRDQALESSGKHEEIVLWFEHDLYDQLQLIQLLDWFSSNGNGGKLSLIQIDSYPGVKPFYGLGQLSGTQLARLFPMRTAVTSEHLAVGREAWQAFCASEPAALLQLATQQKSRVLPFLAPALQRFLQEYPWITDGLSRTERQILQAVGTGRRKRQEIYLESSKQENSPWGDGSVYLRLDGLASAPNPALVEVHKNEYAVTDAGQKLLEGKADWIALSGGIDRWLGGVHLNSQQPQWRWDDNNKTLVT